MFPGFLGLIVLYQIFRMMGLLGTVWSLIIVYSGGAGMGYYICKGFFDTISKQIDEAAMIDGATKFQIFYKVNVIFQLSASPCLAVVGYLLRKLEHVVGGAYLIGVVLCAGAGDVGGL